MYWVRNVGDPASVMNYEQYLHVLNSSLHVVCIGTHWLALARRRTENEVQVAVASWEKLVGGTACGKRSSDAVFRGLKVMQDACQPGYAQTFRRLAQQQDGIHFLVQFRADLQAVISKQPGSSAALRAMSETLRGLLADWFSVGMIRMEQISWKHSSAAMLEKVVAGEAVHSIRGWRDLRRRLSPSKRLFAFFHPSMPDEPLVLLHTALCHGIASKMGSLLMPSEAHDQHEHAPSHTSGGAPYTTAVFYSISSTQPGLKVRNMSNDVQSVHLWCVTVFLCVCVCVCVCVCARVCLGCDWAGVQQSISRMPIPLISSNPMAQSSWQWTASCLFTARP